MIRVYLKHIDGLHKHPVWEARGLKPPPPFLVPTANEKFLFCPLKFLLFFL